MTSVFWCKGYERYCEISNKISAPSFQCFKKVELIKAWQMGEIVYNMSPVTVGERFPKDSVQHDIARSLVLIYHILFSYYFEEYA